MLVVTQVRQALQQTVAMGALSPYFPAAWAMRPVQICFTAPNGSRCRPFSKRGSVASAHASAAATPKPPPSELDADTSLAASPATPPDATARTAGPCNAANTAADRAGPRTPHHTRRTPASKAAPDAARCSDPGTWPSSHTPCPRILTPSGLDVSPSTGFGQPRNGDQAFAATLESVAGGADLSIVWIPLSYGHGVSERNDPLAVVVACFTTPQLLRWLTRFRQPRRHQNRGLP
jgi:hypothetical protein